MATTLGIGQMVKEIRLTADTSADRPTQSLVTAVPRGEKLGLLAAAPRAKTRRVGHIRHK